MPAECKEMNDLIFWSKWYPDMQMRDETDAQFCERRKRTLTKEEKRMEDGYAKILRKANSDQLKKFEKEETELAKAQIATAKATLKLQKEIQKKKDKEDKAKAKWDGLQQKKAMSAMKKAEETKYKEDMKKSDAIFKKPRKPRAKAVPKAKAVPVETEAERIQREDDEARYGAELANLAKKEGRTHYPPAERKELLDALKKRDFNKEESEREEQDRKNAEVRALARKKALAKRSQSNVDEDAQKDKAYEASLSAKDAQAEADREYEERRLRLKSKLGKSDIHGKGRPRKKKYYH